VTATSAPSPSAVKVKKAAALRTLIDDTQRFVKITQTNGGLVPQSMVGTILGVSRQRVHQLVAEGVFSHWTFYGMKWLSQNEVVAFGKLQRRAGENQHVPSNKQLWKTAREAGAEYIKGRRTHGP
jgi:hypothetical protein